MKESDVRKIVRKKLIEESYNRDHQSVEIFEMIKVFLELNGYGTRIEMEEDGKSFSTLELLTFLEDEGINISKNKLKSLVNDRNKSYIIDVYDINRGYKVPNKLLMNRKSLLVVPEV